MNTLKYLNSRQGKTIEHIKRAYLCNRHICFLVCSEPEFVRELICSKSFFPLIKQSQSQPANITFISDKSDFITSNVFDNMESPRLFVYSNPNEASIPATSLTNYVNFITSLSFCHKNLAPQESEKINYLKQSLILVVVKSKPQIPTDIEPYSETITVPFMDEYEFKEFVSLYLEETEDIQTSDDIIEGYKLVENDEYLTRLYQNMMGLNPTQIKAILKKNQILFGNIYFNKNDSDYKRNLRNLLKNIKQEFEQLINTSRALSLVNTSDDSENNKELSHPAGMANIIDWINAIKNQGSNPDDLKKYLLESPKGIIVSGVPGSGKSMMAKYIAKAIGQPLLRFDIGNINGKYVGDSEKNMDEALELIDTLTPCVLWIDEIEKALSINEHSHETSKKIFGKFLTWIQEKSSCFIFATSNDISKMPPELFRSGRFDGKFITFMPTADECALIFESIITEQIATHIKNEFKNPKAKPLFNLKEINGNLFRNLINDHKLCLAGFPKGINDKTVNRLNKFFTGADIAQLIKMAKTQYLIGYKEYNGDAVFDSRKFTESLIIAIDKIKTYGETDLEKIAKCYAQLAMNNFNSASSNLILPFKAFDDLNYKTSKEKDKENLYDLNKIEEGYETTYYKQLTCDYDKCLYLIIRNTVNKLANDIISNISRI